MNRNDYQSGWDTDQFPNNVPEMALAYYHVLQGGGFKTGGTNFDAKLRRQSLDPQDLLIAHIGGMDCCARGLKAAARMIEDKALSGPLEERYAGWKSAEGQGDAFAASGRWKRSPSGSSRRRSNRSRGPAGRNFWRTSSTATFDVVSTARNLDSPRRPLGRGKPCRRRRAIASFLPSRSRHKLPIFWVLRTTRRRRTDMQTEHEIDALLARSEADQSSIG